MKGALIASLATATAILSKRCDRSSCFRSNVSHVFLVDTTNPINNKAFFAFTTQQRCGRSDQTPVQAVCPLVFKDKKLFANTKSMP